MQSSASVSCFRRRLALVTSVLLALAQGKTTVQKLFQHGKLRVDGDVQAAHELTIIEGSL